MEPNQIDKARSEIKQYFNSDNEIIDSDELFISPNGRYKVLTKSFTQTKPDCNWDVTSVQIFETQSAISLFSFIVNERTFFHSWVTKDKIDYLLCAEDMCGGQTIIDLTNKKMSSYASGEDGFIWTKHLLSPDEELLAVFGCIWGSAFFTIIYHFDKPMDLPLKIASEPLWTGYDIIDWVDNKSLKVLNSQTENSILLI